ncbi:hypothetical protein GQ55_3G348600 [Panicum hallii var. hallii]|uniref:Uncharacterized protein n=1 Tax=Panicum hallii var. hallii TaxID=1504633 RepID=A0A2T7EFS7_9POAL|nr:hypothetical protein GQ55_3G348600 [Panicum hallii var. hallii]
MNRAGRIRSLPHRAGSGKNLLLPITFRYCLSSQSAPPVCWSLELGRSSAPYSSELGRRSLAGAPRSSHGRRRRFVTPEARATARVRPGLDSRHPRARMAGRGQFTTPEARMAAGGRFAAPELAQLPKLSRGSIHATPSSHGRRRSIRDCSNNQ